MNTGMVTLNDTPVIDPSELSWGLQDISASDAGRDESARMHKGLVGQVRKYSITWSMISPEDAATILQAINEKEEFYCTLHDAMDNEMQRRLYYVGDRSAPMQQWIPDRTDGKLYNKLSFDLIEVMPNSNTGDD